MGLRPLILLDELSFLHLQPTNENVMIHIRSSAVYYDAAFL
jgi:hypothetical protein